MYRLCVSSAVTLLASGCFLIPDGPASTTADADCEAYLDCAAEVEPVVLGLLLDSYGEDGTCWSAGADAAERCQDACVEGLVDYAIAFPDVSTCTEAVSALEPPEGPWRMDVEAIEDECGEDIGRYAYWDSEVSSVTGDSMRWRIEMDDIMWWLDGHDVELDCTFDATAAFVCDNGSTTEVNGAILEVIWLGTLHGTTAEGTVTYRLHFGEGSDVWSCDMIYEVEASAE